MRKTAAQEQCHCQLSLIPEVRETTEKRGRHGAELQVGELQDLRLFSGGRSPQQSVA